MTNQFWLDRAFSRCREDLGGFALAAGCAVGLAAGGAAAVEIELVAALDGIAEFLPAATFELVPEFVPGAKVADDDAAAGAGAAIVAGAAFCDVPCGEASGEAAPCGRADSGTTCSAGVGSAETGGGDFRKKKR